VGSQTVPLAVPARCTTHQFLPSLRSAGAKPRVLVTAVPKCNGPSPTDELTVLADCLTKVLTAEMHRRVPDRGLQAFRA
jgi:hypothetical protein